MAVTYTQREVFLLTTLSGANCKPYMTVDFSWNIVNQINLLMPSDLQIYAGSGKKEYEITGSDSVYIRVSGCDHTLEIVVVLYDYTEIILSIDKDDRMSYSHSNYVKTWPNKNKPLSDADLLTSEKYIEMINILFTIFGKQLMDLADTPYDNVYMQEIRKDTQILRFIANGIQQNIPELSLPIVIVD
jgi:hypothetical protein